MRLIARFSALRQQLIRLLPAPLRRARLILGDALWHLNGDDGWAMASHVALSILMALFPFLIFVASLAAFLGDPGLADLVAERLFEIWPHEVAEPIAAEVHRVMTVQRGDILTLSVAVVVVLASSGVEAVRTALNRAYRVTETRNFLFLRLQSLLFVVIGAFASLAYALLGILGPLIWGKVEAALPAIAPFHDTFTLVRYAVMSFTLAVVLSAAHVWLPAKRPRLGQLWFGVALTLVLWLVGAGVFAAYLERFADYVSTYAGLAGAVSALFFLYLIAVVLIFGAEVNAAIARMRKRAGNERESFLTDAPD